MRIHFPSVAVGVAAVSLILISMSQAIPGGANPPRIEYGPHPRDMVQIREGTPYVVPPGTIFVLTGVGGSFGSPGGALLRVNGVQEVQAAAWANIGIPTSVASVPIGFTASAGSTIEIAGSNPPGTGRAWGYLSK